MNTIGSLDPHIALLPHYQSPTCTEWADRTWENLTSFLRRCQPLFKPISFVASSISTIAATIMGGASNAFSRLSLISAVFIPCYVSSVAQDVQSDDPVVVKGPKIIGALKNLFFTGKTLSKIAADMWETTKKVFEVAAKSFEHLSLVAVLFVPFHIYNIVQAVKSDHAFWKKALNIITEVGGMIVVAASVIQWTASNVLSEVGAVVPYLLGVSLIFQGINIYNNVKELNKTKEAEGKIEELYQKIINDSLEKEDKAVLENAFKIDKDHLEEFCKTAKDVDKERVIDNLKKRVSRTLISNKIALTATIIETIASVILLTITFVAPQFAPALTIANASLIGCSSILKIAMFIHDYNTESIPLLKAS